MLDLEQHLLRQMAFSRATFGPGERMDGILDHMESEMREVRASGGSADEWVDLVILALDGLTRRLCVAHDVPKSTRPETVAEIAVSMIVGKQGRNEGRVWPDWRTAPVGKAIEHDRSAEDPRPLTTK